MSMMSRLASPLALLYILAVCQVVLSSSGRYDLKEASLRTCPWADFPTTNYLYSIPPESVWDVVAAKHATSSHESQHAVVVAYVSKKDPWSPSMFNSTLACLHRFYRQRDLVFLIVQYEDMSLNEMMQHRIGSLPAFRIYSQGRRFVADGRQNLRDLMDSIEAKTGVSPVGPVEVLQAGGFQTVPGCNEQVDEVLPEDFARAGQGFWLDLAIFTLFSLALYRLFPKFQRDSAAPAQPQAAAAEPQAAA